MNEIKYLFEAFSKYGFWGAALATVAIVALAALKSEWFKKAYTYIAEILVEKFMKEKTKDSKESLVNNITEADVTSHEIFNYINLWKFSMVPALVLSTEYRTAVFKRYLTIYLSCYKENLKNFLTSEYKSMVPSEIKGAFLDMINHIVFDYERQMLDAGIPQVIISKMKAKNNDTIALTIDLIEGICGSNFYESEGNYLKVYSIFNIILSILDNTLSSSERICNSINGELAGFSFSDAGKIVIEPSKKH